MRFTAQEEYGLRCLLQLARQPDGFLTVPEVAQREGLTRSYVAKLFTVLRQADLLESFQGKGGGFRLSRSADRIDVGSVLAALDAPLYCEDFCARYTGGGRACVHDLDCPVRSLWAALHEIVAETLSQTTLNDLLRTEGAMKSWLGEVVARSAGRRAGRQDPRNED